MNMHTHCGVVRHHECDAAGNLKLNVLLDYLQDSAAQHAAMLGFGMEDMNANNLIWVLARLKLKVLKQPKLGDQLEVITYPAGFARLFALRQYEVRINGGSAVQSGSEWLIINAATGRPVNPFKSLPSPMPDNSQLEKFFPPLDKLPLQTGSFCGTKSVGMGDVDLNRHLNNAVYSRYLIDMLGTLRAPCTPMVSELQINFLHAGLPGDELELQCNWNDDGLFNGCGIWKSNGEIAFQAAGKADALPF